MLVGFGDGLAPLSLGDRKAHRSNGAGLRNDGDRGITDTACSDIGGGWLINHWQALFLSSRWDSVSVLYTRLPIESAPEAGWWRHAPVAWKSRQCIPFACLLGDTWFDSQPCIKAQ